MSTNKRPKGHDFSGQIAISGKLLKEMMVQFFRKGTLTMNVSLWMYRKDNYDPWDSCVGTLLSNDDTWEASLEMKPLIAKEGI